MTWVDEEARAADLDELRTKVDETIDEYSGEKEQRLLEPRESLERREEYLKTGSQSGFSDDDHIWADTSTSMSRSSRTTSARSTSRRRASCSSPTSRHRGLIEDAIERLRQVWEVFQTMQPKTSSTTSRCSAS